MAFKDYSELADPLELPINGKLYRLPEIGLDDGIHLHDALDEKSDTVISDVEFRAILLGDALEQMRADGVSARAVVRATLVALADFQRDRATAEIMWETGGDPKALTAWVKATTNRASRRSTSTGAATKTPTRASGTGTRKSPAK